jgi:membrane-associated phospholipid phosphatase
MSAPGGTGEEVRREARLAGRVATGAGAGALVAVPFVLILALVVSEAQWLERIDRGVADRLNLWALARPGVVGLLEVVEVATSPWVFRLAVLVAAAVLWRGGARRLATWAVVTMAVGGLLNVVVKELVARARPTFADPVSFAGAYSFPSGHAQNSMMGAAVLLLVVVPVLGRGGRAVAWTLGAAVVLVTGFDRVALGVHFLSDVVAGWIVALAVVAGTLVGFGAPHRGRSRRSTAA